MHDGKALQSGTSHNFGDGFARAFGIQYSDKNNALQYVHQTSWGMSTRIIGAIIMVHGDDDGLIMPPHIAPTQVMIIPIAANKPGVMEKAQEFCATLKDAGFSVKIDTSDKRPGWKFSEQEMRGIPLRMEVGPKDLEKGQVVLVRRDTREKTEVPIDKVAEETGRILEQMQADMYERAKAHLEEHIFTATDYDSFKDTIANHPGFVNAMWCGDLECELKIKEDTGATSRCMPFDQTPVAETCVCCGKPAKKLVLWNKAY
jgi:prolyl-tRNA synthetase